MNALFIIAECAGCFRQIVLPGSDLQDSEGGETPYVAQCVCCGEEQAVWFG